MQEESSKFIYCRKKKSVSKSSVNTCEASPLSRCLQGRPARGSVGNSGNSTLLFVVLWEKMVPANTTILV